MFNCDNADLWHLEMSGGAHDEAEPVLADVATRMDDDSVADDRIRDRTARTIEQFLSDPDVRPQ